MEKISDKLNKGLSINRMPGKTHDAFIELAKEEFCGDYGMCLKFLIDLHNGLISSGVEHLEAALNDLNSRLSVVEKRFEEGKEEKGRTMLNGEIR